MFEPATDRALEGDFTRGRAKPSQGDQFARLRQLRAEHPYLPGLGRDGEAGDADPHAKLRGAKARDRWKAPLEEGRESKAATVFSYLANKGERAGELSRYPRSAPLYDNADLLAYRSAVKLS